MGKKLNLRRDPNCSLCPLHKEAQYVCLLGEGPIPCDIFVVGEAPGEREDDSGKPFVGKSGKVLEDLLDDIGLSCDDVYITNAVHCRPEDNRTPRPREIEACKKWLNYEIAMVKPRFVLLLGNVPLQAMLGVKGISKMRGKAVEKDGMVILPTYHPASTLYGDSKTLPMLQQDFRRFKEIIEFGGVPYEKKVNYILVDTWKKVDQMIAALQGAVSCDIETTCLYPWNEDAKINTVGFGTNVGEFVIPIEHPESAWSRKELEDIFDRVSEKLDDCILIFQFGKFDCLWLKVHYGLDWTNDFDTGLAHYLLDENSWHDLETLSQTYLGAPKWDIDLKTKQHGPLDTIAKYHAHDLYYTRLLYFKLKRQLAEDKQVERVFNKLMMPCVNLYKEMEYEGLYIDERRMDEVKKYLRTEMAKAKASLRKWGNINWSSPKQVGELLYGKLKIKCPLKTAKGSNSTSETALNQIDHPCVRDLITFRGHKQQLSFFIEGWKPYLVDHRLHPSFKLHGAVTGRPSCLRKGTQVQIPGGTKPIENIRPGDWVYSYDENLKLTLRRVIWAGYTGKKKCYRIHWAGSGGQHEGFLDATADHGIRLIDGSYRKVRDLKGGKFIRWRNRYHSGEHVLALHRQSMKRNFLYATGYPTKLRENRIVFEAINNWSPEHVHHKDDNPLNDEPSNLVGMAGRDHKSLHAQRPRQLSERGRKANATNLIKARKSFEAKTKKRFTKSQIIDALRQGGVMKAIKILGCSYSSLRRRMDNWGIEAKTYGNNHLITRIEELHGLHPVYDITVDGTHNFIANEIAVHNCEHPNCQQIPRDRLIRTLIISPPGWELVECDLSQIELRIVAELSQEPNMMDAFRNGVDIHWLTAMREIERGAGLRDLVIDTAKTAKQLRTDPRYAEAIEILLEVGPDVCAEINEEWKENRKKAKAVNFGYVFSMGHKRFKIYARDNYGVHLTDQQAKDSRVAFFQMYALEDWHDRQKSFARMNGFVRTLTGRKRRLPKAQEREDTPGRAEALRQAINSPVQGFASELNQMVLLQIRKEFSRSVVRPVVTVHDSILTHVRKDWVEVYAKRVMEIMRGPELLKEFEIDLTVPICGEVKVGPWGGGVSLEKWKKANQ